MEMHNETEYLLLVTHQVVIQAVALSVQSGGLSPTTQKQSWQDNSITKLACSYANQSDFKKTVMKI